MFRLVQDEFPALSLQLRSYYIPISPFSQYNYCLCYLHSDDLHRVKIAATWELLDTIT